MVTTSDKGGYEMEIIVQGKLEKLREIREFRCSKCGCEFRADKGEYQYEGSQYNEDYYGSKCPCCGNKVYSR